MKLKWCILVGLIAIMGIASQQHVCLPNQELVLRFSNGAVSTDEAHEAIALVKKQLQLIGANNIQVKAPQKGGLKITYYSDMDAASIKKLLSKDPSMALGNLGSHSGQKPAKVPSEKGPETYNIDVFELKKQDAGSLGGNFATVMQSENSRFFIGPVFPMVRFEGVMDLSSILKETFKFRKQSALAIEITSNKIPDGRAGPGFLGCTSRAGFWL